MSEQDDPLDVSARMARLEEALAEHVRLCAESKKDTQQVIDILHAIKGTLTFAEAFRRVVLWVASIAAAVGGAWYAWKK